MYSNIPMGIWALQGARKQAGGNPAKRQKVSAGAGRAAAGKGKAGAAKGKGVAKGKGAAKGKGVSKGKGKVRNSWHCCVWSPKVPGYFSVVCSVSDWQRRGEVAMLVASGRVCVCLLHHM